MKLSIKRQRKAAAVLLSAALLLFALPIGALGAQEEDSLPAAALVNTNIPCRSAILIEPESGKI